MVHEGTCKIYCSALLCCSTFYFCLHSLLKLQEIKKNLNEDLKRSYISLKNVVNEPNTKLSTNLKISGLFRFRLPFVHAWSHIQLYLVQNWMTSEKFSFPKRNKKSTNLLFFPKKQKMPVQIKSQITYFSCEGNKKCVSRDFLKAK